MFSQKDYALNYHIGYRRDRKGKFIKISFWFLALIVASFIVVRGFNLVLGESTDTSGVISPLAKNPTLEALGAETERKESESIAQIINDDLADKDGTYAVGILNLKTGEEYFKNKHTSFDSASLYKLWVMGLVYERIENGTLKEDAVISDSVQNLNSKFNIASESAERTEGFVTMSVKNAVSQMIIRSDNYSALLLSSRLGLSNLQDYLDEHGLNDSKVGGKDSLPTTSAYDTLQFFYKLYYGELGDESVTDEMITTLKKQVLNEKIPKNLPDNIQIAHKTGELGSYSHDVGIVLAKNGSYIIAVLSKTNSKTKADATIAKISKDIYDYFSSQ